jgi:hypothetical protein
VPPGKKPTPAACVLDPLKSITGPSILPQVQEDLLLKKRWFVSDPRTCFDHIIDLSPLSRKFWPDQNFSSFTKKGLRNNGDKRGKMGAVRYFF